MMLDQQLIHAPVLDHRNVDLDGADRVTYLLEQSFRYDYSGPVQQLRHRLVVLPPAHHGNQHVRAHRVDVHGAVARRVTRRDVRGNTVVRIRAERVERSVQFQVGVLLERVHGDGPVRLAAEALTDPRLLRATRLTAPDPRLRELAGELARGEASPLELAGRICRDGALGHHLPVRRHLGTDHRGRRAGSRARRMPGLGAHHARVMPPARASRTLRIRAPARPRRHTRLGRGGDTSRRSRHRDAVRPVQRRPGVRPLPDRGHRPRLRRRATHLRHLHRPIQRSLDYQPAPRRPRRRLSKPDELRRGRLVR